MSSKGGWGILEELGLPEGVRVHDPKYRDLRNVVVPAKLPHVRGGKRGGEGERGRGRESRGGKGEPWVLKPTSHPPDFFFSSLLSNAELSDTKVYKP